MKKTIILFLVSILAIGAYAAGSESMANIKKQTYEYSDVTNYTGDNGMAWKAVGAADSKVGDYRVLTLSSSVSGNGLSGNLTTTQTAEGVGYVTFYVKGVTAGTGFGTRSFRVTAGNKSVVATVDVPSTTGSHLCTAKVDATNASTLAITMLSSVNGETATFGIYNIEWTSYNGKTDSPTFSTDAQYVANNGDTTYYTENNIVVNLASTSDGATFYYTTNGSTPTTSSTKGAAVTLGAGTHTVKAIAWTSALGESEIATKTIVVKKGKLVTYDASNTDADGDYQINNSGTYTTLSGKPFYQLGTSKYIITDAVISPAGLSCYARNTNSRTLTAAYQTGTYQVTKDSTTWMASSDWTDMYTTATTVFVSGEMTRIELPVASAAQNQIVRLRLMSSGNSVYVDDIITIGADVEQVAMPTFSHAGGKVAQGTTVTVTPPAGATLHYAIDRGPELTTTSALTKKIEGSTVIKAYATQTGKANSWTYRAIYEVEGSDIPDPIHPTSVTLSQTTLNLEQGQTATLTATVLPADADDKSVTWSSSNSNVASVKNGIVTAENEGTATITVTTVDGGLTATCKVIVTIPVVEPIHPTSVTLSKTSLTLEEGAIANLTATVLPTNADDKSVTWTSSNTAVATVSSNGQVKAVKAGNATITVTTVDGGLKATCAVTVTELAIVPVHPTSISLSEMALELNEGETATLTAIVLPENADDKSVVWSSSNTAVATVSEGVVRALAEGQAMITATTVDGELTATCPVTVKKAVVEPVHPESVMLSADSLKLTEGQSATLTATVLPADADNKSVTWSSSNTAVVTVNNGVVKAVKAGYAVITVKTVDGGLTAKCEVIVKEEAVNPIHPTSVTISQTSLTLKVGKATTLTATVLPADADNKSVTWTSSNTAVATVTNQGTINAISAGTTTITVTTVDGGLTATCEVIVESDDEPIGEKGEKNNPYTIGEVIELDNPGIEAWVAGYIVGSPKSSGQKAVLNEEGSDVATAIALADSKEETATFIPVQLPSGDIRNEVNIADHPENKGKKIKVYGKLDKYFGVQGVKNVSAYEWDINTWIEFVEEPATDFVRVEGSTIVFLTDKLAEVAVYTIQGQLVSLAENNIICPQGLYIVRCGNKVAKVLVK